MDAFQASESSVLPDYSWYFATNLPPEVRDCDMLYERLVCSIMIPRCDARCRPLRPCRSTCMEFYAANEGMCDRVGVVQRIRDRLDPNSRKMVVEDQERKDFLLTYVVDMIEGCNNDELWEDDPRKCDDRNRCDYGTNDPLGMSCTALSSMDSNIFPMTGECTRAAYDEYLADMVNNRPDEVAYMCKPNLFIKIFVPLFNMGFVPMFLYVVWCSRLLFHVAYIFQSNHKNITRIAHSYRKNIT